MPKFRIIQYSEDKFIPQYKKNFFSEWAGLCLTKDKSIYEFKGISYMINHCTFQTYDDANAIIKIYKLILLNQKKYPIYHKLN